MTNYADNENILTDLGKIEIKTKFKYFGQATPLKSTTKR